MLYELATGRRAFSGDSWASTVSAVLSQEPKPLDGLPHELERVILRCLRKDPAKRVQHMDDVCVALEELKEESDSGKLGAAVTVTRRSPLKRRAAYGAAAILVLLAAAGAAWQWEVPWSQPAPMKIEQLTSYPGSEMQPGFSPDGQHVAFSWNGEKEDNFDIDVKMAGETNALRITTDPAPESSPAWSRDGKRIYCFSNRTGRNEVWRASPDGGAAARVTDNGGYVAVESTDGRTLYDTKAVSSPLLARPPGGGPKRQLLMSPDRRTFLFTRSATRGSDLMLLENFR
jgi:serine/threonine protein kinase